MNTTKKANGIKLKNPLKKGGFLFRNRYLFLTFIVTFAVMFITYALKNISPFEAIIPDFLKPLLEKAGLFFKGDISGDRMSLVIDQYHQYFPFFRELHEKMTTGGSLLYSWDGGLGINFISLIAYYAMSPVYLLSIFVPASKLTEFMSMAIVIKLSLAASTMFIYLRSTYKKENFITVLLSVCYGLCSYAIAFSWCIMWLDAVVLLPLCLLGLNKLIDKGKFSLYVISLGLIMLTNYYIGVMVCLFIALYYFVLYFSRTEKRGVKKFFTTTLKVIGFSALGCFLASIILVPTYMSMQNVYYMGQGFGSELKAYSTLFATLGNLLPGVEITVRKGLPNIYAGLFTLILAVFFFINKKIPTKKKVCYGLLITVLLISFNFNLLDFIWHGFHYPNELPFRYSFVFSFLLIDMAYHAFINLESTTAKQIGGVAGGLFGAVLLCEILLPEQFGFIATYTCLILLALYLLLLALYKSKKIKPAVCLLLIALVGVTEIGVSAVNTIDSIGVTKHSKYYEDYDEVTEIVDYVEEKDKDFYRMDTLLEHITNDPAFYGYKGVGVFSSSFNYNLGNYLRSMGAASNRGANSLRFTLSTPVFNSMTNLKYIIGRGHEIPNDSAFEEVKKFGASTLYENKYFVSLGYMVNRDLLKYSPDENMNRFENQETFVKLTTGLDLTLFKDIPDPIISIENGSMTERGDGTVSVHKPTEDTVLYYTFIVDEEQDLYMYLKSNRIKKLYSKVGAQDSMPITAYATNSIIGLGHAEAGDSVTITIKLSGEKDANIGIRLKGFNTEEWEKAYKVLSDEMLQVTEYSDTKIKGKITAKQEDLMMTSIPYEKGWSAKIDGQKVKVIPVCNAFCGLKMPAGTHEVEFSYFPEGLTSGIILTCLSIAVLVVLIVLQKKREKVLLLKAKDAEALSDSLSQESTVTEETAETPLPEATAEPEEESSDTENSEATEEVEKEETAPVETEENEKPEE